MPYCNQCGRYIGGGMFCAGCGGTNENVNEEICRGLDGMPTPDAGTTERADEQDNNHQEEPSNIGTTQTEEEEENLDVTKGDDVPGDVTGEVVSEGRTIVTTPEDEAHLPPPEAAEEVPPTTEQREEAPPPPRRTIGARIASWWSHLFAPREGEDCFSPHEMRRGRVMAVMCYLGILWAFPYFFCHQSRYVAYHLSRGLHLLLLGCLGLTLGAVALCLGTVAPIAMPLLAALAEVVLLATVLMSIWRIIRVFMIQRVIQ